MILKSTATYVRTIVFAARIHRKQHYTTVTACSAHKIESIPSDTLRVRNHITLTSTVRRSTYPVRTAVARDESDGLVYLFAEHSHWCRRWSGAQMSGADEHVPRQPFLI